MNKRPRNGVRTSPRAGTSAGDGKSTYPRAPVDSLTQGEQKYRQLFDDAVFGIFRTTADGRFLDANNALANILGYESREELIAGVNDIPHQVHVDPERRAEFSRLLEERGAVHGFEAQVYRKDGSKIWISLSARAVAPNLYEGIAEDITDRKETEAALRSSEERFYKAFHASPAAKSIVTAAQRRFIDVNDRFLALLGYTRDEIVGRTADEVGIWVHPADRERLTEELNKNGFARDIETRLRTRDGSIREVLGSAVIVHVGGELCVLSLLYDITERKRSEEALRESERRYRELIEALGVAVYMTDAEGRITLFNDAAVDVWGRRPELGLDRWCGSWRLYHPDGTPLPHDECPMALTLKQGSPVRGVEIMAERPDGSRRLLLPYPSPLRDASGELIGGVNVVVDITERKQAEEALREREAKLAAILNTAADGIIAIDQAGTIQSFNDAASRIFGYAEEEVVGHNVRMLMPSPYTEAHDSYLRRYLDTGEARIIGIGREVEGRRKDGTLFPLDLSVSEVRVANTLGFTAIVRDISQRKAAEAAMAEQQQRFDLAMQAGRMGAWEWDVATGKVHWSETLEAIHGLAPGEFGGSYEHYLSDIHPDDRQHVIDNISRALESGHHEIEYRIIWPDGSEHWVAAKGELIRNASGQPQRMTGLCMDITERKRIEAHDRFLSEATALLAASSLDNTMTLASLARLAVPHLGDWCDISILEEDGSLKQLALAHQNEEHLELAKVLQERYPFDPDVPFGLANVLRTGRAEFYPNISLESIRKIIQDEELFQAVEDLGVRSVICAPLLARGRTLGAITLATAESGRRYTESDLALAEELGRRAGLALDNARLYADLLRANEAKDEFLGLMSHELRTPITTIYGGARMLRSRADRLEAEVKERLLSDVEQESERLFRMVEDLLALARTELGQTVTIEPLMVQRIIEKVAAAFMQRRPGRPLEVILQGGLHPIAAQLTYVEQVLRNMLSNADKYSPVDKPIDISARAVDGGVDVSVRDHGPGIGEDEVDLIFERFYRSSKTSSQTGAGLGLTVCKRLIEAQSGRVWARNHEQGGLEVGFFLPYYKEAAK